MHCPYSAERQGPHRRAFGYDRERGRFCCFRRRPSCSLREASAGLTKSRVTVGNIRATDIPGLSRGRRVDDMEFVQFHPTGMMWPPSVKGILVTEGVRGEGGVLQNKKDAVSCLTTFPRIIARRRLTTKRKDGDTHKATGTRAVRPNC